MQIVTGSDDETDSMTSTPRSTPSAVAVTPVAAARAPAVVPATVWKLQNLGISSFDKALRPVHDWLNHFTSAVRRTSCCTAQDGRRRSCTTSWRLR